MSWDLWLVFGFFYLMVGVGVGLVVKKVDMEIQPSTLTRSQLIGGSAFWPLLLGILLAYSLCIQITKVMEIVKDVNARREAKVKAKEENA